MADASELDVDQDFIWPRLPYRNLFVLDGATGLLDDLGPLLLWDVRHGEVGCVRRIWDVVLWIGVRVGSYEVRLS